jgi:Na+/H+-translocating membrane pyrophosphatase
MKATLVPTVTVAIAVVTAYHLGASTGIGGGRNSGLFCTAVARMDMLSNAVYVLSMDNVGSITGNALKGSRIFSLTGISITFTRDDFDQSIHLIYIV